MSEEYKPMICVDFDGVLNTYQGYDGDNLYYLRPGAREFLETLSKEYRVVVFSTRKYHLIMKWLQSYDLMQYVENVTSIKPKYAVAFVDDRAIPFNGDYDEIIPKLRGFRTWWEKKQEK